MSRRFFAALTLAIGVAEARAWFRDAVLEWESDTWRLVVPTVFKADWIRTRFQNALEPAARAADLAAVPDVIARTR